MASVQQQQQQQGGGSYAVASAFQRYNLTWYVDNNTVSVPHSLPVVDEYILVSLFASSLITCIILVCILSRSYSISGRMTSSSGHFCMLVNLSVSDICFLVTALPATLIYNNDTYNVFSEPLGGAVCSAVHYVIYVTCYVSMYTMVVTTVFLLCTELIGHWTLLSRLSASVSCVIIWAAFLVANISTLIHPPSPEFLACSLASDTGENDDSDAGEPTGRRVWIMFLVFAFLLPLTVISVLSGIILQCQRRREARSRFLASQPAPNLPPTLPSTPQVLVRQPASLTLTRRPLASLDRNLQSALRHHLANDEAAKMAAGGGHLPPLATDARQLHTPSPASSSTSAPRLPHHHQQQQQQQQQALVYRNKMPHQARPVPTVDLLPDERPYKSTGRHQPAQFVRGYGRSAAINEEHTSSLAGGGGGGRGGLTTISSVGGTVASAAASGPASSVLYQRSGCLVDVLFHRDYCSDDLPSASMQNSPVCDLHGVTGRGNNGGAAGDEVTSDADEGKGGGECHHCGHSLECHWNKSHSTDQDSQSGTGTDLDHPTATTVTGPTVATSSSAKLAGIQPRSILATADTSLLGDSGISSPPFSRKGCFNGNSRAAADTNNTNNVYDFGLYDNQRLKHPALALQPNSLALLEEEFEGIPKMPVFTTVAGRDVNGLLRSPSTDKRYVSNASSRLQSPPPPLPPRFDTTRPSYVTFDRDGIVSASIPSGGGGTLLQLQQPSSTLARYRQASTGTGINNSRHATLDHVTPGPGTGAQSLKRCNGNCARTRQGDVGGAGVTVKRISDTLTLSTLQDDRSDVTTTTAAGAGHVVTCACCTFARSPPSEQNVRRHKEMTILVMATAVSRALCWFPFQVFVISSVYELVLSASAHHTFGAVAVCLVFISPCLSPVIYYAASLDFRHLCNSIFFSDVDSGASVSHVSKDLLA